MAVITLGSPAVWVAEFPDGVEPWASKTLGSLAAWKLAFPQGFEKGGGVDGGGLFFTEEFAMKTQFVSTENLKITLPPFVNKTTGERIIGTDTATIVVKKPDGALLSSPPVPVWDGDVYFWLAEVPIVSFMEGEWLVYATSDDANALPQFKVLTWGDYVDDIPETRQAALGRWKIIGTQLNLYEDDGVTVFKTYDLKDADGNPSATRIFERDPV